MLTLLMKNGDTLRFDGFKDSDFLALESSLRRWDVQLEKTAAGTKGWHWGEYEQKNDRFAFNVDGKPAFELHPTDVAQITVPTKTDLTIELNQDEPGGEDQLLEIRFFVPPGKDGEEDGAERLKSILSDMGVSKTVSHEAVCNIPDIRLLGPSGRYDIHLMLESMKLHGKSSDFTLAYKHVRRMFLLPMSISAHSVLVLALDQPLRKGLTKYPHVILQLEENKEMAVQLSLPDDELVKLTCDDRPLTPDVSGSEKDVVVRLFKSLLKLPTILPGNYKSHSSQPCVRCSHKAASGWLYPLEKAMMFITKPVIVVWYSDIISVEFGGNVSGPQTRMFEFTITQKGGPEVEFSSLDRQEYPNLIAVFQQKEIKVKNAAPEEAPKEGTINAADVASDESDEDFEVDAGDDDEASSSSEEGEGEEEGEGTPAATSPAKKKKRTE